MNRLTALLDANALYPAGHYYHYITETMRLGVSL